MDEISTLADQLCPACSQKKLTLSEQQIEVPYFGLIFVFGMQCSECNYRKSDVEASEVHKPSRYSIEIDSEEDMKIRIIKSSEATVKIPHVTTITPGSSSDGYITNIEGLLERVKQTIEIMKDDEDDEIRKKAKNLLKKIQRVVWGQEKLRITIEDPSGNSAIVSPKAQKTELK